MAFPPLPSAACESQEASRQAFFFFLSYPLQTCLPPILIPNPAVMYIEPIPPLSSWDIRAACVHKKCLARLKFLLQVWRGAKFSFLSPGLKKKNCEKKIRRQPRLPAIVSSDLEVVFGLARAQVLPIVKYSQSVNVAISTFARRYLLRNTFLTWKNAI